MRHKGATLVLLCVVAAGTGCFRRQAPGIPAAAKPTSNPAPVTDETPTPTPTTASATMPSPQAAPGGTFERPKLGIRLKWPPGWVERPSNDYDLVLDLGGNGPPGAANDERPTISLDVPDLPPHLPGMIPIASVRGGYLDDLRKSNGPLKTENLSPPPVPNAAARFVRSTWTDSRGRSFQETALLLVHADRVYILRARSLTPDGAETRAALDQIIASLEWTKPGRAKQGN